MLVATVLFFTAMSVRAAEITIAVASNFTAPMQAIVSEFEDDTEHRVQLAFGSSGKFFAQIKHEAPFDAFFSADQTKPAQLVADGFAEDGSRFTYAEGKLVLWSRNPQLIDADGAALKSGQFDRLAIANPRLAPYGAAALEVMQNLNLAHRTRSRWVMGENISQTYQFVASGNAELGLVALSQVMRSGSFASGSAWIVPESLYNPIRQDAVVLRQGTGNPALTAFLTFVKGPRAQAIIESYGYSVAVPAQTPSGQNHVE